MATALNPRIEYEVKEVVSDIAGRHSTIKETAADLIQIGVGVRANDVEPQIVGPLGIPRPFAKISLGEQMSELRTEIDDELADQLVNQFDNKPNTAAREAIRLGVLAVTPDAFTVKGPAGGPRPFATIDLSEIDDPDLINRIEALQQKR